MSESAKKHEKLQGMERHDEEPNKEEKTYPGRERIRPANARDVSPNTPRGEEV